MPESAEARHSQDDRIHWTVGVKEGRPSLGRQKAPDDRKVGGRVSPMSIAPMNDTGKVILRSDQQVPGHTPGSG